MTRGIIQAWRSITFIDVNFTQVSRESLGAVTLETVHQIMTSGIVLTRSTCTIVDIDGALFSCEAFWTDAVIITYEV